MVRRILLAAICVAGSIDVNGAEGPLSLAVSGRASANASVAASGSMVVAVWSASDPTGLTDVYAAVSQDAAGRFAAPVRVNSTSGQVNVNGEQPPRVAIARRADGKARVIVVWTAKTDVGTALMTAQSIDDGRSFGSTTIVPGGQAAGNRGWESIAADAEGRVSVVWLDHRALATPTDNVAVTHHATSHASMSTAKADGVATAQRSHLYYAVAGEPSSLRGLTGGVCYCCKTAVAPATSGVIGLAWRHVYPGNLRDIAFSISRDNGNTFAPPIRVSEDKWQLEGCPDDGPAMAADGSGRFHIAWPTLVNDSAGKSPTIGLFYSVSRDGKTFAVRERIPTEGGAHHPQMALSADGSPALVWDELVNGKRRIVLSRVTSSRDSRNSFSRQILSGDEASIYPMVSATDRGFIVVWTAGPPANSVIKVARLP